MRYFSPITYRYIHIALTITSPSNIPFPIGIPIYHRLPPLPSTKVFFPPLTRSTPPSRLLLRTSNAFLHLLSLTISRPPGTGRTPPHTRLCPRIQRPAMSEARGTKELSHQDATFLFLNSLQEHLAQSGFAQSTTRNQPKASPKVVSQTTATTATTTPTSTAPKPQFHRPSANARITRLKPPREGK